jgi:hypothetical protein
MSTTPILEELFDVGLIDGAGGPHLTPKGRNWLRTLEDVETSEVAESGETAADLVLSTNGLFR